VLVSLLQADPPYAKASDSAKGYLPMWGVEVAICLKFIATLLRVLNEKSFRRLFSFLSVDLIPNLFLKDSAKP
jgi:hypothetical protein